MTEKQGRPPSDKPKIHNTRIRMSDDELSMLDYCCKETGMTKADIIRKGIKVLYEQIVTGKFKKK